jgi:hypothetical protein
MLEAIRRIENSSWVLYAWGLFVLTILLVVLVVALVKRKHE